MAVSCLDLEHKVRGGLVPVLTLGLWVRLDNVSLWSVKTSRLTPPWPSPDCKPTPHWAIVVRLSNMKTPHASCGPQGGKPGNTQFRLLGNDLLISMLHGDQRVWTALMAPLQLDEVELESLRLPSICRLHIFPLNSNDSPTKLYT